MYFLYFVVIYDKIVNNFNFQYFYHIVSNWFQKMSNEEQKEIEENGHNSEVFLRNPFSIVIVVPFKL